MVEWCREGLNEWCRKLLTRSYNLPDVGRLFGHRINILRSPSGHRPEAGRASVASYGVRIDIGRAAMFTVPDWSSAGTRPMINRRPADLRKASARCLPGPYATFANLWHIVRPPAGGRADAGRAPVLSITKLTPFLWYHNARTW